MGQQSEIPVPPDPFTKRFDLVASQLRKTIRGNVDILEASSRFGVYPSTIQKILDGRTLSHDVKKKIGTQSENGSPPKKPGNHQSVSVARLKQVCRLYQDKGTLAGVGREIGVTRERVRQLMRTGSELKLFDYKPYRPPVIPKKRLLKDYRKHLTLKAVAKIHNVSTKYLQKLFLSYDIKPAQLHALRVSLIRAAKKPRLIARYRRVKRTLGHHPTTTELERKSKALRLLVQRVINLWGSFRAFRKELGIPTSTKKLVSLRQREWRFALRGAAERARTREQILEWYRRVRKRLGYDPLAKQLERGPKSWRRLHERITYRWGNFRTFRKELGIPTSTRELRSLRDEFLWKKFPRR